MKTIARSLRYFVVSAAFAALASAGPVALNVGVWQTEPFTLMNAGDVFPNAYTTSTGGTVNITGYFVTGDFYRVFVNGVPVLTTTQVPPVNVDYGDQTPPRYADPASAFTSGLFSTGSFTVRAGDFITIADQFPPGGIGEAGIQLIPEPATFGLLGLGLGGLLSRRRRLR